MAPPQSPSSLLELHAWMAVAHRSSRPCVLESNRPCSPTSWLCNLGLVPCPLCAQRPSLYTEGGDDTHVDLRVERGDPCVRGLGTVPGAQQTRGKLWLFLPLPGAVEAAGSSPVSQVPGPCPATGFGLCSHAAPVHSPAHILSLSTCCVPGKGAAVRGPKAADPDRQVTDATVDCGGGPGGKPGRCLLEGHSES